MELRDGSLDKLIFRQPNCRLNEHQSHDWLRQVAEGLKYWHEQNIVHLDIKSSNILYKFDASGNSIYKLSDFGLSLMIISEEPTTTNERMCTSFYAAPQMPYFRQNTSHLTPKQQIFIVWAYL
jgi:serine/threonine protein kinase